MKQQIIQLFSVLALLLGAGLAVFAAEVENLDVYLLHTNCSSFMYIKVGSEFRGVNNDDDRRDELSFVVTDFFGTVLLYDPQTLTVGRMSGDLDLGGMNAPAAARPFTLSVYDTDFNSSNASEAAAYPLLAEIEFDPADFGLCEDLPLRPQRNGDTPSFSDGRLNRYDMAAPVVVYPHDFETGRGLVVYSPEGALLLEVRPEALANVAECPEENTLVLRSGDVALYRLTDCRYQLNAPSLDGTKTYVLIFDNLYNSAYISYEE